MAAEPYIDVTDPAYWLELAGVDLANANNMQKREKRYLMGLKCYQALQNALCACFVQEHLASELPHIETLGTFAASSGIFWQLAPEQQQLLRDLQPFKNAAQSLAAKQALEAALTTARSAQLLAETTACISSLVKLAGLEVQHE